MTYHAERFKKILYDHWLVILPTLMPLIGGAVLFSLWKKFKELMLFEIPFWLLCLSLVMCGVAVMWALTLSRELKKKLLSQGLRGDLINNLLYLADKKQAYCPWCFENKNKFTRMKRRQFLNGDYRYDCFACDYFEIVAGEKELNPETKETENLPF